MNKLLTSILALMLNGTMAMAQDAKKEEAPKQVLFKNVKVFNGTENKLHDVDVLVVKNKIHKIAKDIPTSGQVDANVIDGAGKTLMPGLIDSHTHFNLIAGGNLINMDAKSWEEIGTLAAYAAQEHLAMGFTTVRDMGGMHAGLKKVIDRGLLAGPRIYTAGGFISQTGGHGH